MSLHERREVGFGQSCMVVAAHVDAEVAAGEDDVGHVVLRFLLTLKDERAILKAVKPVVTAPRGVGFLRQEDGGLLSSLEVQAVVQGDWP